MNKTDYITIQAPMVTDLKLSGNNLIIFALIHGFCKDGKHVFTGSLEYISEWTNLSKPTIIATLKLLAKSGFLNKEEKIINNVKFCEYTTNYESLIENFKGSKESKPPFKKYEKGSKESKMGSKESKPNNIQDIDNDIEIKEDTNVSKKEQIDFDFIKSEWERINPNLSSIRSFSEKRKKAVRILLKNNNACVDDLIKCFEIISVCSFCNGNNTQKWEATIDWVINDTKSCFNRLLEGAYSKNDYERRECERISNGGISNSPTDSSNDCGIKFQF